MRGLLRQLGYLLAYGALGVLLALLGIGVAYLRHLPQPGVAHTADLDDEFRARDAQRIGTLAQYRAQEDRLFAQLEERVYERTPSGEGRAIDRFSAGSLADPLVRRPDWNRTFVWDAPEPRGGVLLLHGLTDSPYSMRALAELARDRGYTVVGLRFPGHGTAPSGLVTFAWEDMAAATRLAARDLAARIGPDRPLFIAGYSTGAAIAVEMALARIGGEPLPRVAGLILMSPAIGVSPAARFAVWQGKLAAVPGLEAATWTDVAPEYDPYKYASFSINAADQVYRLTRAIQERFAALDPTGAGVRGMPPILAFQSAFDATVSAPKVVTALFARLAPEGHELVVFDLNRNAAHDTLLKPEVLHVGENLLRAPPQPFALTVITNESARSSRVVAVHRAAGAGEAVRRPTTLAWPANVFSMSHVAVPFRPDDPLYGATPPRDGGLYLGRTELLGERGLLAVPVGDVVRLRHNPFWPYVEGRVAAFLDTPERGVP